MTCEHEYQDEIQKLEYEVTEIKEERDRLKRQVKESAKLCNAAQREVKDLRFSSEESRRVGNESIEALEEELKASMSNHELAIKAGQAWKQKADEARELEGLRCQARLELIPVVCDQDGSGTDTGDWLDVIEAEIKIAIGKLQDGRDEWKQKEETERSRTDDVLAILDVWKLKERKATEFLMKMTQEIADLKQQKETQKTIYASSVTEFMRTDATLRAWPIWIEVRKDADPRHQLKICNEILKALTERSLIEGLQSDHETVEVTKLKEKMKAMRDVRDAARAAFDGYVREGAGYAATLVNTRIGPSLEALDALEE